MAAITLRFLYRNTDRHGNERVYFRRAGKKIRIREPVGSPEFLARYNELLAAVEPPSAVKHPIGTLAWLCAQYYRSSMFQQLDPRTQHVRRLVLESACQEPINPNSIVTFGQTRYVHITAKAVRVLRDRKLKVPESANARVKALRQVLAWAIEEEIDGIEQNVARSVRYLKGRPGGFHTWTTDEVAAFEQRHPLGTRARLVLDLLLYLGVRRSDVICLGRQHQRDGKIRFVQQKNKERKPKQMALPVLPVLQRTIDASPTGDLTFLINELGVAFTPGGFGNWFRDRCVEAGVPGRAHGLRKAGATLAANRGASAPQLQAIFGWETLKDVHTYTKAAEQERLADGAMHMLSRDKAGSAK